jgi:malonyl-CoA/methylmalonyl-CoA synthetase
MKIISSAFLHATRTAIVEAEKTFSYQQLLDHSASFAAALLNGKSDLQEERVAFMVDPGFDYVKVQWAIWRAGGIAVPLCLTHPLPSLQYVLEDTEASIMVVSPAYASLLQAYAADKNIRLIILGNAAAEDLVDAQQEDRPTNEALSNFSLPDVDVSRAALILYTSGTTNKPKGVVLTHANLEAQMENLVQAWEWTEKDHTLCVLPLHHVHGIVNVVGCSLFSGAVCEFIPSFSAQKIFGLFQEGKINVFMAVPTIYYKLITYWEGLSQNEQQQLHDAMEKFRLMVCGSAALPVSTMEKWEKISGHVLLERYGMTEIGMAISNPYRAQRRAGHVGIALPNVEVRLVDEKFEDIAPGEQGEILVRGGNVFREYWRKPAETEKEFTADGWFKTGDVAIVEDGYYRIVGRSSVDIIKSGGYKISALEIEEVLREHSLIKDCAVAGIPDDEWGELVVAAVEAVDGFDPITVNAWIRERMPAYKTPKRYLVVETLPRNAMGKVVKNDVKQLFI